MKKIGFVNYDMTVTGGVEQVTTALANAFCAEYEVFIFGIFGKEKEFLIHLILAFIIMQS